MALDFSRHFRVVWTDLTGPQAVAIASLAVTTLVLGVRQLGSLQLLELVAFDRMVQLQPHSEPDPRILIVAITEADINTQKRWPLPDQVIAQSLAKLQLAKPRVIGLDLHRNFPQEPGAAALRSQMKASNFITITKIGTPNDPVDIDPPADVTPEQVGFNDVLNDPDGAVRRSLMVADTETATLYSFSMRLAMAYLTPQNQLPHTDPRNPEAIAWGASSFVPLATNSGGYQNIDDRGYQFLINYRSAHPVARQVTLTQLLNGEVDSNWIADKIVLIGVTAPSIKDIFSTPYSRLDAETPGMPGVTLHAHILSQILDAATGDRSLFWFWSEWVEILWIASWSILGGSLAWRLRQPLLLGLGGLGILGVILGAGFGCFLQRGWIPVVTPAIATLMTGTAIVNYRAQKAQRQQQTIMTLLGQNTSPEIAAALWKSRDRLVKSGKLPGQRLTATMFFTDIKDFSTISEQMSPEDLLNWLNDYLEVMTEVVQAHQGIINKFTGDGMMAVFGVPVPRTTTAEIAADAQRAVACALSMGDRLQALNIGWQARGLPMVQMRAGIFTGDVVVGSLGGKERLEYGVIGDSVNIASRLESCEKERQPTPCRVLIAQETLVHLQDQFEVEPWGPLALKGKSQLVEVYRVIGDRRASDVLQITTQLPVAEPFAVVRDIDHKPLDLKNSSS